jgi:hypothetical protein
VSHLLIFDRPLRFCTHKFMLLVCSCANSLKPCQRSDSTNSIFLFVLYHLTHVCSLHLEPSSVQVWQKRQSVLKRYRKHNLLPSSFSIVRALASSKNEQTLRRNEYDICIEGFLYDWVVLVAFTDSFLVLFLILVFHGGYLFKRVASL